VLEVLGRLQENQFYLKPEKCELERQRIEYLGLIITPDHIEMDPKKISGVTNWPVPKRKRDIQSFLGFANFYRRFIKDFSLIAKPMTKLTGKVDWQWGQEQQEAFDQIKKAMTFAPVLAIPTQDDPIRLECDASDYATGAVLSQQQQGLWHPLGYISGSMSETERNYEVYDKELLSMMLALEEWRHLLIGAKHPFEIWSDHRNLTYFKQPQKVNRRQARWITELADYNFTPHHRPRRLMAKADAFSRRSDHDQEKDDNENTVVLKIENFHAQIFNFLPEEQTLIKKIRKLPIEPEIQLLLEDEAKGWTTENGLVLFADRVYVPNSVLREQIIALHHDTILSGHPGINKTHELITRNYFWPKMSQDVNSYVKGCEVCQRTKIDHRKRAAQLHPHAVPERPWETISVDMIGPLPESQGYDAILHIVDHFTKEMIAIPTHTRLSSEGWAREFVKHVFSKRGLPKKIISDRGPQFVSKFIVDLYRLLGIQGNPSTAYHPQTDGQTERLNQEIELFLRIYVNYQQNDWAEWLAIATFNYNDKIHASTGQSPFFLNHGYHPRKGIEPGTVQNLGAKEFVDRSEEARSNARKALEKTSEQMK
jgi:hypothetical protein